MRKAVHVGAFILVTGIVAACSSSADPASGVPLGPGSGSSSGSSGSSGSETDPRAAKYCYRYFDKSLSKGLCICGMLFCAKKPSGECGCFLDPLNPDLGGVECTPAPLATPTNGQTQTTCCIGADTGGGAGLCRCNATSSCDRSKEIASCDRSELTTKQLVPGNLIYEDDKYRLTAMSKSEVDQWVVDGRATKQGANTFCNEP